MVRFGIDYMWASDRDAELLVSIECSRIRDNACRLNDQFGPGCGSFKKLTLSSCLTQNWLLNQFTRAADIAAVVVDTYTDTVYHIVSSNSTHHLKHQGDRSLTNPEQNEGPVPELHFHIPQLPFAALQSLGFLQLPFGHVVGAGAAGADVAGAGTALVTGAGGAGMMAAIVAKYCCCKSSPLRSTGCPLIVNGYLHAQPLREPGAAHVEAGVGAAQLPLGQAGMLESVGQGLLVVMGVGVISGVGAGPTSEAGIWIMLEMILRLSHCHQIRTRRAAI